VYTSPPCPYNVPRQEERGRSRTTTFAIHLLLRCCIAVKARYEQHPGGIKVILDAHDGILESLQELCNHVFVAGFPRRVALRATDADTIDGEKARRANDGVNSAAR
jgi:hypothetical protein